MTLYQFVTKILRRNPSQEALNRLGVCFAQHFKVRTRSDTIRKVSVKERTPEGKTMKFNRVNDYPKDFLFKNKLFISVFLQLTEDQRKIIEHTIRHGDTFARIMHQVCEEIKTKREPDEEEEGGEDRSRNFGNDRPRDRYDSSDDRHEPRETRSHDNDNTEESREEAEVDTEEGGDEEGDGDRPKRKRRRIVKYEQITPNKGS